MKLVCWNLGAAYGRWRDEPGLHDRAWHWIAALDPDIALLQEVNPPAWARERWIIHAEPFRFWASAIASRPGTALEPVSFDADHVLGRFGAYLATGELTLADGARLLLASVHTSAAEANERRTLGLDRMAIARSSVGVPWWNDVAFSGYRPLTAGRRFVIGGDWNTSRYVDEEGVPDPAGAEFFARAAAAGWREISLDGAGSEGRSWYGSTNPRPHQPDHVFADPATAAMCEDFEVNASPVTGLGLSDHAPLVLELGLALPVRG